MPPDVLTIDELADGALPVLSPDDVLTWVDVRSNPRAAAAAAERARRSHRVLVGIGSPAQGSGELLDALMFTLSAGGGDRRTVPVESEDVAASSIDAAVRARPIATTTLAGLLTVAATLDVHEALIAESMAYSTLQGGPEYGAWLADSAFERSPETEEPIVVDRVDDRLIVTLDRPNRHNALNAAMRDALVGALQVAVLDDSITALTLTGNGRSFCSGGDLAEFGTASDPASAHLIRTEHRPAEQIHQVALRLGQRCEARVHGAVMGGGLELAAFAGRVVADRDSVFTLPELSMGLVPGAGGTVSVARRIGRWRTAWMVVSGKTVSAQSALDWGLVDEVSHR